MELSTSSSLIMSVHLYIKDRSLFLVFSFSINLPNSIMIGKHVRMKDEYIWKMGYAVTFYNKDSSKSTGGIKTDNEADFSSTRIR